MSIIKPIVIISILLSVSLFFSACNSQGSMNNAQAPMNSDTVNVDTTVFGSQAEVIYFDHQGHLWFSNKEKGVYRYDGENTRLFTANDGLKSYQIISVQEDEHGSLYFDTPNGVYQFKEEEFTTLPISDDSGGNNDWKNEASDLWFRMGWDKKGPYRFDGTELHYLEFPKNEMEDKFYDAYPNASFNPYAIYSFFKDSNGWLWFGTSNLGVYLFDGENVGWMYEHHLVDTPTGGNFGVRSIGEDKDGNYWICNASYKYSVLPVENEGDGLKNINYKREVGIENLPDYGLYFYGIYLDNSGHLIMNAQDSGVWINDGKDLTQLFILDGDQSIPPTSIFQDQHGVIWMNTERHGIYQYDGITFTKFTFE